MPLKSVDLLENQKSSGFDSDLGCHCLTTKDNITACCLTSFDYLPRFAKKLLNNAILEFRDFFSFNPSIYKDISEDQPDWDTSLEHSTFGDFFL